MTGSVSPPPSATKTSGNQTTIRPARGQSDFALLTHLSKSYALSLGIDLAFQDFGSELRCLPGKYSPENGGEALLAFRSHGGKCSPVPIGCVALRALDGGEEEPGCCCEMKRLYVAPEGRGLGTGKELAGAIVRVARELKYRTMKLDTLPTMVRALDLYRKLGFVETEPYYETPIAGTVFLAKELGMDDQRQDPR